MHYLKILFSWQKISIVKIIIGISVILFMTNLNAIVDSILHPDIPYFDSEHLIVGGTTGLFSLLFFILLNFYINHLNIKNVTQAKLILELQTKKEELKVNESKLKEINDTKDKLFSIIAHDLKNPFSSILGFSELLIKNIGNYNAEKSENFLKLINSSIRNTIVLLDNLLNWVKSQSGQLNFTPEKNDLSLIIQEIIEISNIIASIKNISFNNLQSDSLEVYADQNMLKTVLRNLVFNSIKFTNHGGEIDIYAKQIHEFIEITVSDNGVGIYEEDIKKLFNLETNITTTGTNNEKGSGLGLVLCKEFVEIHGGEIWVESEKGKGSDFKFTLPLV
ncbi:MAG: hypothetical protein GQ564_17935 [Bacteroidales bacterium]|nr:hypothetical protein [Bacteroidales bacterium]